MLLARFDTRPPQGPPVIGASIHGREREREAGRGREGERVVRGNGGGDA